MFCKNCGEELNPGQGVCLKCGVAVGMGNAHCEYCGMKVSENASVCLHCGCAIRTANGGSYQGIAKRSIVLAIILSLVTCGLYSIYWFIVLTDEINKASGRTSDLGGGLSYLLSLVTCGIYTYFWAYKLGEKCDLIAGKASSSAILYLLLQFIGLGIIPICLAQDTLNKAIEKSL